MPRQTLTWIALPRGIVADQRARVTAFALPRLDPQGREAPLGTFSFADWPEHLRATQFSVDFGGRTVACDHRIDILDAALWRAVFPADLPVRMPASERLSGAYGDVPVAALGDHMRSLHQDAMPQPTTGRGHEDALAALAASLAAAPVEDEADTLALQVIESTREAASDAVDQLANLAVQKAAAAAVQGTHTAVPLVADRGTLASAFARLAVFHQAPMREEQVTSNLGPGAMVSEFHQRLTLLGDYPELLRRLGLVVELSFAIDDAAAFAAAGDSGIAIRALTPPALPLDEFSLPRTGYAANHGRFKAKPRGDGIIGAGFVDLARRETRSGRPAFSIVGFDVHAAGLQQLQFHRDGTLDRRPDLGPPSLRTIGISLVQAGRAATLIESAEAVQRELTRAADGQAALLCAEDLLRGHRMDVRDARGGRWHSLHRRVGQYRPQGQATFDAEDEGVIVPALRQSGRSAAAIREQRHDESRPDFVDETLCSWSGWSLSAPRPGAPMPQDVASPADQPDALPVSVSFRPASKSLPRLRFGTRYELRLRTVDLAGNSPSLAEDDAPPGTVLPASGGWAHRRFEPIGAPVLARVAAAATELSASPADPVDVIVLRGGSDAVDPRSARLLLPPVVSAWMAEQHGAFDGADGSVPDAAFTVAALLGEGPDGRLHRAAGSPPGLPDPAVRTLVLHGCPGIPPGQVGRFQGGRLVLEQLALPVDLAPADTALLVVEFAQAPAWPRIDGVMLMLSAGSGPPSFDAGKRTLTIQLPPAGVAAMRIGCAPTEAAAELFATFAWAIERLDDDVAAQFVSAEAADTHRRALPRAAALGMLPAISPLRDLWLEHAVQAPLAVPTVLAFEAPDRRVGDSIAFLGGRFAYDRLSTGRLELHARWTEPDSQGSEQSRHAMVLAVPVPNGSEPLPRGVSIDDEAATISLRQLAVRAIDAAIEASIARLRGALLQLRHAFAPGDDFSAKESMDRLVDFPVPRHANLGLLADIADNAAASARLVTADAEHDDHPGSPASSAPQAAVDAAETVVTQATGLATSARRAQEQLQLLAPSQEFGDQRHRQVEYRVEAISRFADRYPPGTPCSITSPSVRVSVPSSVRPSPPAVTRIVPTFAWARSVAADGMRTTERRTGLRVYLELPWFSSGEGECLAVLLGAGNASTRWARDPVFFGGQTSKAISSEHFTRATVVRTGLRLGGIGAPVTALGHAVAFDATGECFADLSIEAAPAYAPFVQLALARLQEASVIGSELSEPCRPTPVQLLPRRQVTVRPRADGALMVEVAGATHASAHGELGQPRPTGNLFRLRAQRRRPGAADDLGWDDDPGAWTVIADSEPGELLWRGTVTATPSAAGERRLLLEEFERWPTQARATVPTLPPEDRLIFADVIASAP